MKERFMKFFNALVFFYLSPIFIFGFIFGNFVFADSEDKLLEIRKTNHPNYLRLPIDGNITTIDPGLSYDMSSIELTEQLFLGLTGFERKGSNYVLAPELALNWTIHENGTVYRFNLRKDVYWVSGITGQGLRSVTAHDIVWALRRNIDPKTETPYSSVLYILKNAEDINTGKIKDISKLGVHALDDFTVEFQLNHPASYFLALTAMWIYRPLPKEAIDLHNDEWTNPECIQTNGPYMLHSWRKGRQLVLKKNNLFYDSKKVSIPEVRYNVVIESFAGLDMFLKNELDVVGDAYLRLPMEETAKFIENNEYEGEFFMGPMFAVYSYFFNSLRSPTDNPLVRRAISYAFNRAMLVEHITRGNEKVANTFTPPMFLGYSEDDKDYGIGFNPHKAKELLEEAGYPDGKGFPELILVHNLSETHVIIAKTFQEFLDHYLNIKLTVISKEWDDYVKVITNKDKPNGPHMFQMGWSTDYLDANNWLNDGYNYFQYFAGWNDDKIMKIVEKANNEQDSSARYKLFQEAEKYFTKEQAYALPVYFLTAKYLVNPCIKNWYHMPIGGQHIPNWKIESIYLKK